MTTKSRIPKPALTIAVTALALTLIPFTSNQVMAAMFGFFKRYDVELSPEVHGQVTEDGTPLEAISVSREVHYDKSYTDETVTDKDGRFSFPPKAIRSSLPGKLFAEPRTIQFIHAHVDGQHFLLWHAVTGSTEIPQAFRERLTKLNCDITNPEITHHFTNYEHPDFDHNVGSICRWE